MIQTLIRINIYISLVKRYLRQYCDNGEIVTAAAKSLRVAATFIQTQPSLTELLTHSFAQKRTQKQLVIISSAIYIQDNKNNYVSNVFPVFFTSSNDIRTNPELHFLISKITATFGANDSNVLSESDPKYLSKKLHLIYLLTYKTQRIYTSYRVKSHNTFILKP